LRGKYQNGNINDFEILVAVKRHKLMEKPIYFDSAKRNEILNTFPLSDPLESGSLFYIKTLIQAQFVMKRLCFLFKFKQIGS
jgi:hypothetical protein